MNARQKARLTKAAKEKKYNDRVEKTNSKKFAELKEKAIGDSMYGGGVSVRPTKPII